jgi:hypothetical protein
VATNARRVLEMKIKMDEIMEISKQVAKKSSRTGKYDTIVFRDGTISTVTSGWEAIKPVWCIFSGELDTYEVAAHLILAYEDEDGCPCRPPGYRNWMQEHPEEREKIGSYLWNAE